MTALTAAPPQPVVPRPIRWAAKAVALSTVPSGIWRIALGLGIPVGFSEEALRDGHVPGWGTAYVIVLSLLAEGLALLTLGLVKPWGEVVPNWIPRIGGRRIPTAAAVIPASLGAIAVTWITLIAALGWNDNAPSADFPEGGYAALMVACYAPLLAWGPLLAVVTAAYYVRRQREQR